MQAKDLPNDLEGDWIILSTRLNGLLNSFVKLGEEKSRIEMLRIVRELMQEKEQEGDNIAAQVIEWMWMQIADRFPTATE